LLIFHGDQAEVVTLHRFYGLNVFQAFRYFNKNAKADKKLFIAAVSLPVPSDQVIAADKVSIGLRCHDSVNVLDLYLELRDILLLSSGERR
jgi:hypothetical protein